MPKLNIDSKKNLLAGYANEVEFSRSERLGKILLTYVSSLPESEGEFEELFLEFAKRNKESFAKKLRLCRIQRSLTQQDVFEEVGVTKATFSGWENGVNIPRIRALKMMLYIYRADPADLLEPNPYTSGRNFAPLLSSRDIQFFDLDKIFYDLVNLNSNRPNIPVKPEMGIDFAYKIEDSSMEGLNNKIPSVYIPKNSIALISFEGIKDNSQEQKKWLLNGKVALVNISQKEALLRYISYENGVLSLIPLNKEYKTYNFPDRKENVVFIEDKSTMLHDGKEKLSDCIEFIGYVKSYFVNL